MAVPDEIPNPVPVVIEFSVRENTVPEAVALVNEKLPDPCV